MNASGAVLKKIAYTAISALCLALAMMSVPQQVLADDTDVFFPPDSVSAEKRVRPNILFVLDTSGSMVKEYDGLTDNRLQRLKTAFSTVMSGLSSEVNVGVMKFSGFQGGPVLFPVSPIDAYVDDIDTLSNGNRVMLLPISDAYSEASQVGTGTTTVGSPLTLAAGSSSNVSRLALRFNNVAIPKGVTIANANVMFHVASGSSGTALPATIKVEMTGDSQAFISPNNSISSRSTTGSPSVSWPNIGVKNGGTGTATTTAEDDYVTPDIADLLNAIIKNNSSWCGGQSITIIIESTTNATRSMVGYADDSALAPTLNLSYNANTTTNAAALSGSTAGCINQSLASQVSANTDDAFQQGNTAADVLTGCGPIFLNSTPSAAPSCGTRRLSTTSGLRFLNLNIKRNATIRSAKLQVVANGASSATPTLTIKAEKLDNPATYAAAANNITGRTTVTASVSRSTAAWTDGQVIEFDVKDVIQEVVNQGNWAPNDPISIIVTGNSTSTSSVNNSKPIHSRETSAGKAARLLVSVQGGADRKKVRDYLQEIVNEFQGAGGTPTMGALYEAARYYRGENAFYGLTRSGGENITQTEVNNIGTSVVANLRLSGRATFDYSVSSTTGPERPAGCSELNLSATECNLEKWTGTRKYLSPVTDGCQSNNIILMSDGDPNNGGGRSGSDGPINKSSEELIGAMIGNTSCVGTASNTQNGSTTRTNCGPELARFLSTQDQIPNSTIPGTQTVKVHAIAFGKDVGPSTTGGAFLRSISVGTPEGTGGGGQFFSATSADEVAAAFDSIISQILDVGTTFVAPAVTVNTFNRLTNRNELYFALFQPSATANWPGNLKRYQVRQASASGSPQIYDKNGAPAIDASTGFFADSACSYWTSTCNDGADVSKGGAASQLTTSRKVYTNLTGNSNVDLTTSTNAVTESNTGLTKAILGIPSASDDDRTTLLQWARGIDVNDANGNGSTTDARTQIGDPLHSKPTVVSYGGTDANPDLAVFYGDNHGYLHAVNASATSGQEYFSFIPKELLTNLNAYYDGSGLYSSRPYGVDGPIVPYIDAANSKKYVYVGLRRGGRSYYALDVTDRSAPKLAFTIAGGTTSSQGDFRELGQSWATPVLSKVRYNNTNYGAVLIFTGGYDPGQDSKTDLFSSGTTRSGDSQGRAIYVVDATSGQLLWWAGSNATATPSLTVADMVYSIPATPTPIDTDGDGYVDRIYFADAGGQVFRLVLNKDSSGKSSLSNARADVVAKLSAAGVTNSRRFFNTPDVALVTDGVVKPFFAISIGTGHRERPLDTGTADRFYILKDPDVTNDTNSSTLPIAGESELYDATSNLAGSSDATVAKTAREAIYSAKGLYLRLGATEKVLSESSTFNNQVIFASYTPPSNTVASDACKAKSGDSRFYQINITDATPAQDFNNSGTLTTEDRFKQLTVAGLPPDPIILFPDIRTVTNDDGSQTVCNGSECTANTGKRADPLVCVGAVCFNLNSTTQVKKSYWRKVE